MISRHISGIDFLLDKVKDKYDGNQEDSSNNQEIANIVDDFLKMASVGGYGNQTRSTANK
jgi:hypothetical protein